MVSESGSIAKSTVLYSVESELDTAESWRFSGLHSKEMSWRLKKSYKSCLTQSLFVGQQNFLKEADADFLII